MPHVKYEISEIPNFFTWSLPNHMDFYLPALEEIIVMALLAHAWRSDLALGERQPT
jgi:hypothetical protein